MFSKGERFRKNGDLLEGGFGTAFFLLAAREAGWNVTGVEVSEAAVAEAKERQGI